MVYGDVVQVRMMTDESANSLLEKGWVVLSASYVPGSEEEHTNAHFSILIGWPRERNNGQLIG